MGSKYYTEAQAKASRTYIKEKVDQIVLRVPKGQRAVINQFAKDNGYESANAFINELINEKMKGL